MKKYLSTRIPEGAGGFGLLILRLFAGCLMLKFGYDKLTHFNDMAKPMNVILGSPIDGILVVFAEFFCSALLIMGLFTRFAVIPLIITMAVAFFKAHNGVIFTMDCNKSGMIPFMFLGMYLTLLFTGPGKFSVDRLIAK